MGSRGNAGLDQRWPERTLEERFREKFAEDEATGCWIWSAATHLGYGWFGDEQGRPQNAHRVAYELWVGPIPPGMTLDHLCHTNDETCAGGECRHRRCVNPAHLEPVTLAENKRRGRSLPAQNARKTHCPRGHAYDDENTYVSAQGYRDCRRCSRDDRRAEAAARRAARSDRICAADGCSATISRDERPDRLTCSPDCRQRYYRQRKRQMAA